MVDVGYSTQFNEFIGLCTEDYLIRYANKGLYNRALKEIAKGARAEYTLLPASVSCQLDDGTMCTLYDTLEKWECSCPSEAICKHVLISVLYYQQVMESREEQVGTAAQIESSAMNAQFTAKGPMEPEVQAVSQTSAGIESEEAIAEPSSCENVMTATTKVDFSWLLTKDPEFLIAGFKPAILEEVVFRLKYEEPLEVKHDSLLTVRLARREVEVSFTGKPEPTKALCTVKGKEGDLLRLEALLRYRRKHGLKDAEALNSSLYAVRYTVQAVRECRRLLQELLLTGLARLPESMLARLEIAAVTAHSGELPEVERQLRGLKGDLELFFNRHIRSSMGVLLDRITRLELSLKLLEEQQLSLPQLAELAGEHRSRYFTAPRLQLYGLGAEPWETRSGYRGITYYFYCPDDQGVYTYTDARPVFYERNEFVFGVHYASFAPWLPGLTMQRLSREQLEFRQVKVNRDRRISSSDSAVLELVPRNRIEEISLEGYLLRGISQLEGALQRPRLFAARTEQIAVLKLERIVDRYFDQVAQELLLIGEDADQLRVTLTVPYDQEWKTAIKALEKENRTQELERFYTLVRIQGQKLYPISFLKGTQVVNLKLDL